MFSLPFSWREKKERKREKGSLRPFLLFLAWREKKERKREKGSLRPFLLCCSVPFFSVVRVDDPARPIDQLPKAIDIH